MRPARLTLSLSPLSLPLLLFQASDIPGPCAPPSYSFSSSQVAALQLFPARLVHSPIYVKRGSHVHRKGRMSIRPPLRSTKSLIRAFPSFTSSSKSRVIAPVRSACRTPSRTEHVSASRNKTAEVEQAGSTDSGAADQMMRTFLNHVNNPTPRRSSALYCAEYQINQTLTSAPESEPASCLISAEGANRKAELES